MNRCVLTKHELYQLCLIRFSGLSGAHALSEAENGHAITYFQGLFDLMGNEKDPIPHLCHAVQSVEQVFGICRNQRGRLIKNQDFRIMVKHLYDLSSLLLPGREVFHSGQRVNVQFVLL